MSNKDLSMEKLLTRIEVLRANVVKRKAAYYDAGRPDKHLRKLLTEDKNRLVAAEKVLKQRKKGKK